MTRLYRLNWLAGFSSLLLIPAAATELLAQGGPTPVVVAPVITQDIRSGQTFVGTILPEQKAVIGSAVDGRVVEFPINEGDRVRAGQTLAQLLTETINLELTAAQGELSLRQHELEELQNGTRPEEVEEARAMMEAARAQAVLAKKRLERVQRLVENGNAATEDQLDEARATADNARAVLEERHAAYQLAVAGPRKEKIAQAQARVAMQQAVVDRLQDQIKKHTIISRFDGYVTAERTELGEWVNRGDPVAEVVALDRVDVLAHVLEAHVPFVREGMPARVEVSALPDRIFTGTVSVLVPAGDERSRTFPVKVRLQNEFDGDKPLLNAGMLARVTLATGISRQAMLIPKDALVLGSGQSLVHVIDAKDPPPKKPVPTRMVPVTLGIASDSWIEVTSGLEPGERVVVQGNERLKPGQSVIIARELPPLSEKTAAVPAGP